MQLFRTVCMTDHKGRPSHNLTLVGETNEVNRVKILKDLMDRDVREWQAHDVVMEETEGDMVDDAAVKRVIELANDPDLALLWKNVDRFEMQSIEQDRREFVERMDGEFTTVVYHFFGD